MTESVQRGIRVLVESERFNNIVFVAILASSIAIGFETYEWGPRGDTFLQRIDGLFLTVFVLEILLRIYAMGRDFFRDPWCVFDFLVVGIALIPEKYISSPCSGCSAFVRAFRLVSRIP